MSSTENLGCAYILQNPRESQSASPKLNHPAFNDALKEAGLQHSNIVTAHDKGPWLK